jgi:HK97 family phage major capsid protein
MPTNSLITRSKAGALIPEEYSSEIIQNATESSVLLRLARQRARMSRKQLRMPMINSKPTAYFVNGDTGLKQTTEVDWTNVFLNAEVLAVIIPVPEEVLEDTDYNIYEQIMPEVVEAFGIAIDKAMLTGENKPSSWPTDILAGATAAGNTVSYDSSTDDLYDKILGIGGVIDLVERDGFMVNGHVATPSFKAHLRSIRDAEGRPIFREGMTGSTSYSLDGQPMYFVPPDILDPATEAIEIAGDWKQLQFAIRQDMRAKLLTESVIQDGAGNIVLNLSQQDAVALRVTMRLGFVLPNPISRHNTNSATRYPFAALTPA